MATSLRKPPYARLDPLHSLEAPVTALMGVTDEARRALAGLGINSIFDLAVSRLFESARLVTQAAGGPAQELGEQHDGALPRVFEQLARLPRDLLDETAGGLAMADLPAAAPLVIQGIGPVNARALAQAGLVTVSQMAGWPPYRAARALLGSAAGLGGGSQSGADAALLPASGGYPTERVQYTALVLDKLLPVPVPGDHAPKDVTQAGALDLADPTIELLAAAPGIGAVLTFTQSWYPEGLALGQLLHTVALAPGETTRLAFVDWSRAGTASGTEDISQREALSAVMDRSRSISEVTHAVAKETQTGSSHSWSIGAAGESGTGAAYGMPAGKGFLGLGAVAGVAAGGGYGNSWSTSSGTRDLTSTMTQDITDRTSQAANSVRNRRATLVQEVTEKESETLTTRSITNYNHMHALSVEYYEVVQLYRCLTELTQVDRCLYLPLRPVDFAATSTIDRYRTTIAAAGLTDRIRRLAELPTDHMLLGAPLRSEQWRQNELASIATATGHKPGDPASVTLLVPDINIHHIEWAIASNTSPDPARVVLTGRDGTTQEVSHFSAGYAPPGAGFTVGRPVSRITVVRKHDQISNAGQWRFSVWLETMPTTVLHLTVAVPAGQEELVLLECEPTVGSAELVAHLRENRDHYTQAIWATASRNTVAQLLSRRSFNGIPLLEQVDPTPVGTTGGHLVFRFPTPPDDPSWKSFLDKAGVRVGDRKETLVPLPSGGVFAEAVLGRANSAERLDLDRFWNWQDSPIPITAPDIAALQAGSRAHTEPGKPGDLGAPVLNVVNAPAVPDPANSAAILAALANGAMFRDMSGLADTIKAAQQTIGGSFTGAGQAQQAGAQLAQAALEAAVSGVGATGGAGGSRSVSERGALLNKAAELDGAGGGSSPGTGGEARGGSATSPDGSAGGHDGAGGVRSTTPRQDALLGAETSGGGGSTGPLAELLRLLKAGIPPASGVQIAGAPDHSIDPNETVELSAAGLDDVEIYWSDGGAPASGTGRTFVTRFPWSGSYTVECTASRAEQVVSHATVAVIVRELSGPAWAARHPGSKSIDDLTPSFRAAVINFRDALEKAGATVRINQTYRPPERAYLMHYAWRIKNGLDPAATHRMAGVDIAWVHRQADGDADIQSSRAAASQLCADLHLVGSLTQAPALNSRHTEHRAIDMTITWPAGQDLNILDAKGNPYVIVGGPYDGSNQILHVIGATYGVRHVPDTANDPPHWSDDGH